MRQRKHKLAAAAAALLAVGGAGGAIAATQLGSPDEQSRKILDDAARQLGVSSSDLSAALKKALKNRVDEAQAAGRLTEDEATALKRKIDAGDFPLIFGGPFSGPKPFFGGQHKVGFGFFQFDTAATYLGVTQAQLRTELGSGSTLADVAKEKGKSVDGLVNTLVAAAKKDLDAAVEAGKLTRAQANSIAKGLDERLASLVNGGRFGKLGKGFFFGGDRFFGGERFVPGRTVLPPPVFNEDRERFGWG